MKRILLAAVLIIGLSTIAEAACSGSSPNWTTAAATETAIRDCLDSTVNTNLQNGDTVTISSGTINIAARVTVTKQVTVTGQTCTLATVSGKTNIPTSCPTILNNTTGFDSMFEVTLVANLTTRFTNLELQGSGLGVTFLGQGGSATPDSRRYRADHIIFDRLSSFAVRPYNGAWGVVDHASITMAVGGTIFMYPASLDYDYADERWAETTTDWGTNRWNYLEDSVATCEAACTAPAVLTDGFGASKVVVRFNHLTDVNIQNHGTEDPGRARGGKAIEAYQNTMTTSLLSGNVIHSRSGGVLAWGNTVTGFTGSSIITLNNYRSILPTWGIADGTSPWDSNDAGNPLQSYTAAANSTDLQTNLFTVTVSSVTWTLDQWRGYSIHKSGCTAQGYWSICGLIVRGNTAVTAGTGTITYEVLGFGIHADFAKGDTIQLNKVTQMLDAPCRVGGTNLSYRFFSSITHSGPTMTVTLSSHGYSVGQRVFIWDAPYTYVGTYAVSEVVDANTFKYVIGTPPTWSASTAYSSNDPVTYSGSIYVSIQAGTYTNTNHQPDTSPTNWVLLADINFGTVTPLPAAWNDQTVDPCYQWLNSMSGGDSVFDTGVYLYQFTGNATAANYFDYDDDETFDGTFAANRSSIGVGVLASRPATCTTGVAYWATDQGSWNSTGDDGLLYVCTAANTWTLYYTPFEYPYPGSVSTSLSFTTQPVKVHTGNTMTAFVVKAMTSGVVDASYVGDVTVALTSGCTNASVSGTLTVTAVAGVATFSNVTGSGNGVACQLIASGTGGVASGTSSSFDIGPNMLAVTVQPSASYTSGTSLALTITAQFGSDASTDTGANNSVTLTLNQLTGSGALSGSVTQSLSSGVRAFSVTIQGAGTFNITASTSGLTSALSNTFSVSGDSLVFTTQPPASVSSSQSFSVAVTARLPSAVTDTSITNSITLAISSGSCIVSAPIVSAASGVATFASVVLVSGSGTCTLSATGLNLTSGTSDAFTVSGTPPPVTTGGILRIRARIR